MATLRDLERDAYKWANNLARNAAKEIMNGLAEAGPNWSGEFRNSWVAESPAAGTSTGVYPYNLRNIPQLPLTKREVERVTKFIIRNTAEHAAIAMDLADVPREEFTYPGTPPEGTVVARGKRPDVGKRGDVSGTGKSRSTAPLDWYTTYTRGGKMQKALERGIRLAKPE